MEDRIGKMEWGLEGGRGVRKTEWRIGKAEGELGRQKMEEDCGRQNGDWKIEEDCGRRDREQKNKIFQSTTTPIGSCFRSLIPDYYTFSRVCANGICLKVAGNVSLHSDICFILILCNIVWLLK